MTNCAFMFAHIGTKSWIATVPPVNVAVPWYFGRLPMLMSRLRQIDAPRRLVVLEGELAAGRAQVLQRRREPLRARRLAVVVVEAREVVRAVPLLDQHLPVGHLDRADRDVGLQR